MSPLRIAPLLLAMLFTGCGRPTAGGAPAPITYGGFDASLPAINLREGGHYQAIVNSTPSSTPKVIEFFSYGCPACNQTEPFMRSYEALRPRQIIVERVPMKVHDPHGLLLKAYYIGLNLGIIERSHPALFRHLYEARQHIDSRDDLVAFFVGLGVDEAHVQQLIDSDELRDQTARGVELARRFGVHTIPTFVINDRYSTTRRLAGAQLGAVLDTLALRAESGANPDPH